MGVVLGVLTPPVGGTVVRERGSRWMQSHTPDMLTLLAEIGV